tara:strand:- start:17271 stop:19232 length:1962 start_codon:yes stop_codon:yes gene_type:complete
MSEPRRSTRARAREEAAPAPETPKETPVKGAKATGKRKRGSIAVKDSTPSTPIGDTPQGPKQTLPLRVHEGQPLPTLPEPQPLELPAHEWQDIQQSGVLSASLQRSRAVWVSGVNFRVFHKYFNQPKKPADRTEEDKMRYTRQKDLLKNFPELGRDPNIANKDATDVQAQLVIEPHTFPIRLYAPREAHKPVPKRTSTQPVYGAWPNTNQPHHSHPNQHTYNSHSQPAYQQKPPQPRPPPPKPVQKAPQPTPGPASTPAPDPVIHMLAQRAGVDPELKAVMKIVAAGEASKDQLEFFQTHINELTAVLAKQKENAAKSKGLAPSTTPAATTASPAPKALPPPPTPQPIAAPPPPRPVQPAQPQHPIQNAPKPYSPTPPQGQLQQFPPRPSQPPYPTSYNQPPQQYSAPRPMAYNAPPQLTGYRPLVFSFEEGNKDLLHFPSYSFLEWLPNHSGAKISFLITKMKPKPEQDAFSTPSTPAPKAIAGFTPVATPAATPGMPTPANATLTQTPNNPPGQVLMAAPATTAHVSQPRIEDFDEKKDVAEIEFYQPVTVLLLTDNHDIRHALTRAIRPPDVVEKYMDEVFDKCKRAEETYLAFRLPREGDGDMAEKRIRSSDGTPGVATPTMDGFGGSLGLTLSGIEKKKAGRPRKSLV